MGGLKVRIRNAVFSGCVALLLGACGGGGGGGSGGGGGGGASGGGGTPPAASTISGYVVKGPTGGANVQLQTINSSGLATLLAQTTTAADGAYAFTATPPTGALILVKATGGTFTDESTNAAVALASPLRALDVWNGTPHRVSLSAFSEAAVRSIERTAAPSWTVASAAAANAAVAEFLGVPSLSDFRPVDLRAPINSTGVSELDLDMSLYAGAFSAFARRLAASPAQLDDSLENLYRLIFVDRNDDRLFPAFLGGIVDFIDLTSLTSDQKRQFKSALLLNSDVPLNDAQLQAVTPHGVSSGMATAPMTDDAFALLGFPGGHTAFNKRGALIGYTTTATTPDWVAIYSASVGEVFGDGGVGIGR